jgi:hypothetical protein
MMNQNDTIKLKSWEFKEVGGNHWAEHHVIYGVNETLVISLRKPMGLIGGAETCRYTPVWVVRADSYTVIPGRMKFGADTLQPGLEKTTLDLDGIWEKLPAPGKSLSLPDQHTLVENHGRPVENHERPAPSEMRSTIKLLDKPTFLKSEETWNNGVNSFIFTFLLMATSLYIVSSISHWKCYMKELFLPMRKRKI